MGLKKVFIITMNVATSKTSTQNVAMADHHENSLFFCLYYMLFIVQSPKAMNHSSLTKKRLYNFLNSTCFLFKVEDKDTSVTS